MEALTEKEITRAIEEDADTFEPEPTWFAHVLILRLGQPKERLTVRFDEDMVHWFKEQGKRLSDAHERELTRVLRSPKRQG